MDVSKIEKQGEWLELEAVSEKIGKLRFKIQPITTDIRLSEEVEESLAKIVVDWDLEKDGEKLPCNEETIKEYMPFISVVEVKSEDDRATYVGIEIIRFAQNVDNFVKN